MQVKNVKNILKMHINIISLHMWSPDIVYQFYLKNVCRNISINIDFEKVAVWAIKHIDQNKGNMSFKCTFITFNVH